VIFIQSEKKIVKGHLLFSLEGLEWKLWSGGSRKYTGVEALVDRR